MKSRKSRIDSIARRAAFSLCTCAVLIFGATVVFQQAVCGGPPQANSNQEFYRTLPGIDLRVMSAGRLAALLKRLNAQRCDCECMRTVASCRNHHRSCSFSEATALQAVAEARER